MLTKRAATLADVAALAQVHVVTASKVLHSTRAGTRVSEPTRQRIVEAAEKLQYRVNAVARSLRTQSTNVLGLSSPSITVSVKTPFWTDVIEGLQFGCEANKKDLLLFSSSREASVQYIYSELVNGRIDGLFLLTNPFHEIGDLFVNSGVPVIAIADRIPGLPSIFADDDAGARMLAEHLAERGHTRIMYRLRTNPPTSIARRHEVFCDVAAKLGMTVTTFETNWTEEPSAEQRSALMGPVNRRPTAAVNMEDVTAYHFVDYCISLDLDVPRDIAVVGFDGIQPMIRPAYELTTVRVPWSTAARTAVDLMMQRLGGEDIPLETILKTELIIGKTT